MAYLNTLSSADAGSRGQLFLIGAIALTIAFVALTMLLNTAIYTENLAARSGTGNVDTQRAVSGLTTHAERATEYVNYRMNLSSGDDPSAELENLIETGWASLISEQYASSGVLVDVSVQNGATTEGQSAARTEQGVFAGDQPDNDGDGWKTKDIFDYQKEQSSLSDFRVNVDPTTLASDESKAFSLRADGTDLRMYSTSATNNKQMIVSTGNRECSVAYDSSTELITVNTARHTVNGGYCEAVEYFYGEMTGNATGHTTTKFRNHKSVKTEGTWMATLKPDSPGDVKNSNPSVYSTKIVITYATDRDTTTVTIPVTPGGGSQ